MKRLDMRQLKQVRIAVCVMRVGTRMRALFIANLKPFFLERSLPIDFVVVCVQFLFGRFHLDLQTNN